MGLIIAANWKMYKTAHQTAEFCRSMRCNEVDFAGIEVLICPPATALSTAAIALKGSSVKLGAQNMHWAEQGAYTGEIAASMLLELGVEYVIIGHSERRQLMHEDDTQVQLKLDAALANGLKPILCVGETAAEREQGITKQVIEKQLAGALANIEPGRLGNLVIAYEPVWAIGTGQSALPGDAENAAEHIRNYYCYKAGEKAAAGLRIQYGGSVKADNIGSFVALSNIQGALVGGASLEASSFSDLLKAARRVVLT